MYNNAFLIINVYIVWYGPINIKQAYLYLNFTIQRDITNISNHLRAKLRIMILKLSKINTSIYRSFVYSLFWNISKVIM